LIDIGINLTNARFDKDRAAVIERAILVDVKGMLVTGTSVSESKKALSLCHQYPQFLACTAGVHPHDADNVADDYIEQLKILAANESVKAIGECGLDFNRNFSTPKNQQRVFNQQVELASELSLPLFLHQRDAFEAWLEILTPFIDSVPAMVSHCFTGDFTQLKQCLDHDMYIGITGWVCDDRRGQELRDIVKNIPLNRLLIETDAPYLTPRNIRPKPKSSRNEPCYLPYVIQTLVENMPYSAEEIIQQTFKNTQTVFNWEVN
jgi:TatD DNase family protein